MSDLTVPIPPTDGIADPQARAVLDALAHNARAAAGDGALAQMREAARSAVIDLFQGNATDTSAALDAVVRRILASRLLAELRTPLGITDLSRLLTEEERERIAGQRSEEEVRTARDFALASAVNRVWATIGGSAGVIEDASLSSATPSTATATKWNQVVSAVTDPNTGQVVSAALKQTFDTYASTINGYMTAAYTLRTDVNGHVAGFGLINDGTVADFIINADAFAIVAPGYAAKVPFAFDSTTGSLRITGDIYAANGEFGGKLTAGVEIEAPVITGGTINGVTGTFKGALTADALNAVSAINLAGNAVNASNNVSGTGVSISTNITVPAGKTWKVLCLGFQNSSDPAAGTTAASFDKTLTLGDSSVVLPGVYAGEDGTVSTFRTIGGSVFHIGTVVGPATFTATLTGTAGVAKTLVIFGAPA